MSWGEIYTLQMSWKPAQCKSAQYIKYAPLQIKNSKLKLNSHLPKKFVLCALIKAP